MSTEYRILLADDEEYMRRIDKEAIEVLTEGRRLKTKYEEAKDGRELIELTNRTKFDLIKTDYDMPHINGFDVIKKIRSDKDHLNYSTPVIVCSGGTKDMIIQEEIRVLGLENTIFINKPYRIKTLLTAIQQFLPSN